jgi:hypothetical protein
MNYELLYININRRDTIRSTFTPNESNRSITYKLPAQLEPNTAYRMVFWPKPKETFNSGSRSSFQPKVSESVRTINMAGSGSVVVRNRTAQVAPQKVGDIPVYSILFRTSQFSSLDQKLTALGEWKGKVSSNKMTIANSNGIVENFDECDVIGFRAPNGTAYGPLLSVLLDWESSKTNDKFIADKVYSNAFVLTVSGAQFNFAAPEARKDIYKPVYTLDWRGFATSSPLVSGEFMTQQAGIKSAAAVQMSSVKAGSALQPGKLNTAAGATVSAPLTLTTMPAHKMTWTRETLTQQDFELMKSFAAKVIAFQKTYSQLEKTLGAAKIEDDESPQLWTTNKVGGSAYVPLNKLQRIYGSTVNMNMMQALRSAAYEAFPKTGTRTLRFKYGVTRLPYSTTNKVLSF